MANIFVCARGDDNSFIDGIVQADKTPQNAEEFSRFREGVLKIMQEQNPRVKTLCIINFKEI